MMGLHSQSSSALNGIHGYLSGTLGGGYTGARLSSTTESVNRSLSHKYHHNPFAAAGNEFKEPQLVSAIKREHSHENQGSSTGEPVVVNMNVNPFNRASSVISNQHTSKGSAVGEDVQSWMTPAFGRAPSHLNSGDIGGLSR